MKKILGVLVVMFLCLGLKAQTSSKYYMFEFTSDTMEINWTHNIDGISVSVPSDATDSTLIKGNLMTISGITSTGIKLAPGEYFNVGNQGFPIFYLFIGALDKARVVATVTKVR